ncbi:phosphopentomutase [Buchnera aphidicola]|uniref:phosphopentomutase n=1 Tax=Buchnera aphidicola TaxID=9 RepID=UPI0031B8437C
MKRVFILLLDSLGIGSSEDSDQFGDKGSDTLGNIAKFCFFKRKILNKKKIIKIPNLLKLGLSCASKFSTGKFPLGCDIKFNDVISSYAYASSISTSKDTLTGHWEIVGLPILFKWDYFKKKKNSIPKFILDEINSKFSFNGWLGNCRSSGTFILNEFGNEHIFTKKPIIYTSSDSVVQIACDEKSFGLRKLYNLGKITRLILDRNKYKISRVIIRPFIKDNLGNFLRTSNRFDFCIPPYGKTVLEKLIDEKNGKVIAIGKVSDIFSNVGITETIKISGLSNLLDVTIDSIKNNFLKNVIIFTNFVDFDSLWGHRRDVVGYANGLEYFDKRIPEILNVMRKDDLLIITSDHGCDPTWKGTDHTRENIPILLYKKNIKSIFLGHRKTFSDIGQTIASYFSLSNMLYGKNMLLI